MEGEEELSRMTSLQESRGEDGKMPDADAFQPSTVNFDKGNLDSDTGNN